MNHISHLSSTNEAIETGASPGLISLIRGCGVYIARIGAAKMVSMVKVVVINFNSSCIFCKELSVAIYIGKCQITSDLGEAGIEKSIYETAPIN